MKPDQSVLLNQSFTAEGDATALGQVSIGASPNLKSSRFPPELERQYRCDTDGAWREPYRTLLTVFTVMGFLELASQVFRSDQTSFSSVNLIYLFAVVSLILGLFNFFNFGRQLSLILFIATQLLHVASMSLSAQFIPEPIADRRMMATGIVIFLQNIFLPLPLRTLAVLSLSQIIIFDLILVSHIGLYSISDNLDAIIKTSALAGLSFLGYRLIEKERRNAWYSNQRERQKAAELAIANKKLQELSNTDGLTGLGNRRSLDHKLSVLWQQAAESQTPLSLLMLDIDHFKKLNDTFGHNEGDHCLRIVSQTITRTIRQNIDFAGRYGGEEFVIILPDTNAEAAFEVAERIRVAIELSPFRHDSNVTASFGVASAGFLFAQDTPETLLQRADAALYRAKSAGRNQTVVFTSLEFETRDTAEQPQVADLEISGKARVA